MEACSRKVDRVGAARAGRVGCVRGQWRDQRTALAQAGFVVEGTEAALERPGREREVSRNGINREM